MFGKGIHRGQFRYAAVLTGVWTCGCCGRVGDCGSSLRACGLGQGNGEKTIRARGLGQGNGEKTRKASERVARTGSCGSAEDTPYVVASSAVEAFAH